MPHKPSAGTGVGGAEGEGVQDSSYVAWPTPVVKR